jgi:hypothetical protein
MDAIPNLKAMAGSPDADAASRALNQRLAILRMAFSFQASVLSKTMKDKNNV